MTLIDTYSGVVINQNVSGAPYDWRTNGAGWLYQTFTLPSDYTRGTTTEEQRIPDLSGIQVFVTIDSGYASSASLDFSLQWYGGIDTGWIMLTSGTIIGAQTDGEVWFDIPFVDSVPVTPEMVDASFRFGIQARTAMGAAFKQPVGGSGGTYIINGESYTATLVDNVPYPIVVSGQPAFLMSSDLQVTYSVQQGVSSIGYVTPSPLTQGQAFQSDALTPLLGFDTTSSLNFRILGLTVDSGTNFLDNEYRSAIVSAAPGNTSTTGGISPVSGNSSGSYWMSPPLPSRFAVQSLYFDLRPIQKVPTFGLMNLIGNPSFEFDGIGLAPPWWTAYVNGGTIIDQTVHSTQVASASPNYSLWAEDGAQVLHMHYTFSAADQELGVISPFQRISATTQGNTTPISISLSCDLLMASASSLTLNLLFYDDTQTLLPNPFGVVTFSTSTLGVGTLSGSTTVPANAVYVQYLVSALSTGAGSFEAFVDAIQATTTSAVQPYFDGDDPNCQWTGQRDQSSSVQLISPTPGDTVVIDGILVDPLTPNMAFNVYYSTDDAGTSNNMTEMDWEQKLWTRVPEVYICTQSQQYAFPEPVQCKYAKVEFTNLQSQTYNVSPFQKPVQYKKFPTWVANFFIALLDLPSFVATQVSVQYDALGFAYNYYLDDLDQEPETPSAPPSNVISQLTSYFNPANANAGIDPTTLAQIDLVMDQFEAPLGTYVNSNSTLGSFISSLISGTNAPTSVVEGGTLQPIDYSTVSTLQREPIVFEQSLPIMYFFVTCRHSYKELSAPFEYNRAYFAGVNEIAFIRNDYTIPADTPLYIESGGDLTNIDFTDWVIDADQSWYTYGA